MRFGLDTRLDEQNKAQTIIFRLAGLVVTLCALVSVPAARARADEPICRSPLVERQRFGFVATDFDWPQEYDIARLHAGWYVDHTHGSTAPSGMDRAIVIRTPAGYQLDPARLGPLVDNNLGAIWLIGNEPDCIWQDDLLPEEYARIYHDLYAFIKDRDATSQVAAGGIVQPTPLRLEYLNRVLAAYQTEYHQKMPADLWHIHNAILNEERGSWGAEIPPGFDVATGALRSIDDNDNMAIFQEQIWAFRQWMAGHGYRGLPLVITEYGVLMPKEYGFDEARVNRFMSNTFAFLQGTADPTLGDPNDGFRLVQRWAWFSLDVPPYDPITLAGFNGNLFDPATKQITGMGQHYASQTSTFPALAYVDLALASFKISSPSSAATKLDMTSRLLRLKIANVGTLPAGPISVGLTYDGPTSGAADNIVLHLAPAQGQWTEFELTGLEPGAYLLTVQIDPNNQIAESRECNNQVVLSFVTGTNVAYLPVVSMHQEARATPRRADTPQHVATAAPGPAPDPVPGFWEIQVPTPRSYPAQIALDAQGRLWVTERDANKIARFDPFTVSWNEYSIPTLDSKPWDLVVDGSGNVWFTESAASQIGRLEPASGTISEFPTLTSDSQPWDMVLDNYGKVWFTERAANRIATLNPANGQVTEYSGLSPNAEPTGIAASGNSIWFVETAADGFGRLKVDTGEITERLRPSGSMPQEMAVTEAGNLWWTETGGNRIISFAPSTLTFGTTVTAPTANSAPFGIAMEGNQAVWFTEQAANKLARWHRLFTPPVEFPLPTPNSAPTAIVIDSAGCAWYSAPAMNRIGRLCLARIHLPSIPRAGP